MDTIELQYYDQFEYRMEYYKGLRLQSIIEEMNELGKEGWEFVSIITPSEYGPKYYLFKRRLVTVENGSE